MRNFRPGERRFFEPAAIGGKRRSEARAHTHTHTHTHTHACPDYHSGKHTHTHTAGPTGSTAARNKQALPVCTGARSQREPNQNPMSCPLHHYHHHSGDITAHLLIATRPYLCLQPPPLPTPNTQTPATTPH